MPNHHKHNFTNDKYADHRHVNYRHINHRHINHRHINHSQQYAINYSKLNASTNVSINANLRLRLLCSWSRVL